MNYELEISKHLDKAFAKLRKKDPDTAALLKRKVAAILENPYQFKPLRQRMAGIRRVHVKSFVLTYEILEEEKIVRLLDYEHHDKIYY